MKLISLLQDIMNLTLRFIKKFTNETGIKVNVVSGKSKVLEKELLKKVKKVKLIYYF